jgi:hypothetical protein
MDYANLVVVHECGSEIEADLAKGALEAAGIDAMIQADTAGRRRAHIAWPVSGFKLLVREEDAVDAREVLDAPPWNSTARRRAAWPGPEAVREALYRALVLRASRFMRARPRHIADASRVRWARSPSGRRSNIESRIRIKELP